MSNYIVTIVDWFITLRKLKIILFFLSILLFTIVINTLFNILCINEKIIAAYMIGISALLASTVAMINIRISYINSVVDKKDTIIALTHNAIIRIGLFYDQSNVYRKIFLGEELMLKQHLNLFEPLLKDILELLKTKEIHRYIAKDESELLYRLHANILLILTGHNTVVEQLDEKFVKSIKYKSFDEKQLKLYNDTVNDLEQLTKLFGRIRENELEEYNKILKEEN